MVKLKKAFLRAFREGREWCIKAIFLETEINRPWLKSACSYIGWECHTSCLHTPQDDECLAAVRTALQNLSAKEKNGEGYNSQRLTNSSCNSEQWRLGWQLWMNHWPCVWCREECLNLGTVIRSSRRHLDSKGRWGGRRALVADPLVFNQRILASCSCGKTHCQG